MATEAQCTECNWGLISLDDEGAAKKINDHMLENMHSVKVRRGHRRYDH